MQSPLANRIIVNSVTLAASRNLRCLAGSVGGLSPSSRRSLYTQYVKSSHEQELPKLPVPPLKQSVTRFLDYVRLIVKPNVYQEAVDLCTSLEQGDGKILQSKLEEYGNKEKSWLFVPWAHHYLGSRAPTPPDNPVIGFPLQNYSGTEEQLKYAARSVSGLLDWQETMITKGELPVDRKKDGGPLEMYQYEMFIGTTRIPGHPVDDLRLGCRESPQHKHITVSRNGRFFKVQVYDKSGNRLSEGQILSQLKAVVEQGKEKVSHPVALMTGAHREPWAKMRARIIASGKNAGSLEGIETGLFNLCLDTGAVPGANKTEFWSNVTHHLLFGAGPAANSGNRWFDKSIQLVIGENGGCGILWEHGPGEAHPPIVMEEYILQHHEKAGGGPVAGAALPSGVPEPVPLDFELTAEDRADIEKAGATIKKMDDAHNILTVSYDGWGSNTAKRLKCSPDSFVQMALQLAYFRLHGTVDNTTYETGHLRNFQLGRTEVVRSPTEASIAFLHSMNPDTANSVKAQAIHAAIAGHQKNMRLAMSGYGFDRHFVALQHIARWNNIPVPALFQHESYAALYKFKLSTSQIPQPSDAITMYGPGTYPFTYGCAYNPRKTNINFCMSSLKEDPNFALKPFADTLFASFAEMEQVLTTHEKEAAAGA